MALLFSKTRRLPADRGRGPNDVDNAIGTKAAEPKVARTVRDALLFMAASLTDEQLSLRDPARIAALLPWSAFSMQLGGAIDPLQSVIKKSALVEKSKFVLQKDVAVDAPPISAVDITPTFDLIDKAAVAYANAQAGKMIVAISNTLRDSIRTIVTSAVSGEISTYDIAKILRSTIPLHPAWASAVAKTYERTLAESLREEDATMSGARALAQRAADLQAATLVDARSWNIARTEVQTAANQGRYAGWEDGVAAGYIRPTSLKVWEEGRDPCPICAPLVGEIRPWDQPFSNGSMMPPEHPSCRCSASLLPPDASYLARMADQSAARDAASFAGDAPIVEDLTLAPADAVATQPAKALPPGNIVIPDARR